MVLTFVGVSSLFKSSIAAGEGFNPDINYKLNLDTQKGFTFTEVIITSCTSTTSPATFLFFF